MSFLDTVIKVGEVARKVKEAVSYVTTEDGETTVLGRPVRYHFEGAFVSYANRYHGLRKLFGGRGHDVGLLYSTSTR